MSRFSHSTEPEMKNLPSLRTIPRVAFESWKEKSWSVLTQKSMRAVFQWWDHKCYILSLALSRSHCKLSDFKQRKTTIVLFFKLLELSSILTFISNFIQSDELKFAPHRHRIIFEKKFFYFRKNHFHKSLSWESSSSEGRKKSVRSELRERELFLNSHR